VVPFYLRLICQRTWRNPKYYALFSFSFRSFSSPACGSSTCRWQKDRATPDILECVMVSISALLAFEMCSSGSDEVLGRVAKIMDATSRVSGCVSSSDDHNNSPSLQAVFTVELALLELTNLAIHERNRSKAGTFILRFKFWLSVDRESRNIFLAFNSLAFDDKCRTDRSLRSYVKKLSTRSLTTSRAT
jgi:hypothetical protein